MAGIAHEINTPVGAIRANAEVTERAIPRLEEAIESGDSAGVAKPLAALRSASAVTKEATDRIVRLVRSLKSFARLDEAEEAWTSLNTCVESTLPLLRHELENGVELSLELGSLPSIRCHPNQINQIVMNVILNAIQAIEGEGSIAIRTWADEGFVILEVEDDGVGIRPEHQPHVFDPGFTTKGVGVGTGLGLSISYRIATQHGGDITFDSTPGVGTSMRVRLPVNGTSEP